MTLAASLERAALPRTIACAQVDGRLYPWAEARQLLTHTEAPYPLVYAWTETHVLLVIAEGGYAVPRNPGP